MRSVTAQFGEVLGRLALESNLRKLPEIEHDGMYVLRGGKRMLNLSSNDYLGLAQDMELRDEFLASVPASRLVMSSSSSRLLTGNFTVYRELEELLASLYGREAALVAGSGYHINLGILPAVTGPDTLILADKLVHASIIDGIRLSQGDCIRFRHNNMQQLETLLEKHSGSYRRIIIVTESVFSMDGDEADLEKLTALRRKYDNVMLYVDEAHAFGTRGSRGLGCAQEKSLEGEVDFLVGTFGKAAASAGAFVVCDSVVREFLVNRMRPLIFSTALPPVTVEWTKFIVSRLEGFGARRERLASMSSVLRSAAAAKGYAMPSSTNIIPLITGASDKALELALRLQDEGFFALAVRPPTVPQGSSRIRLSLSAAAAPEDIARLADII